MSYQPEPTSVAARVIAYLATKPAGSQVTNAELSHKLGAPTSSFDPCMKAAVNAGLVHKRWHEIAGGRSTICWVLGPRVIAPTPTQALVHEPAQEEATTTTSQPDRTAPAPADQVTEEIRSILDGQADPAPAAQFACALFNDGRLYLELGEESMTLQVEHTRSLLSYLERVAMP